MAIGRPFRIIILTRAKLEADEAAEFYQSKRKGLGKIFYKEFRNAVETLKINPFFEEKYSGIRVLPLQKFPYCIHFSVDEENKKVLIHALTCDYQNPENIKIKI